MRKLLSDSLGDNATNPGHGGKKGKEEREKWLCVDLGVFLLLLASFLVWDLAEICEVRLRESVREE